jgi:hypothetical protein
MARFLVACEYSGVVRDALIERGHDVISCDFEPGEGKHLDRHYRGDVRDLLAQRGRFDAMIAHPSCTYLCNSGVRWLHDPKRPERWDQLREGAEFFKMLLNADIEHIALENPVMHKYAKEIIGADFTFSLQPWQHGHGEVKRTCFWLKNLPPLTPTDIVDGRTPKVHFASPGKDRWKIRSRTYDGVGIAMADQWGTYVEQQTLLKAA